MDRFNIYHRRDGRWEGRISQGKREHGKTKFQYFFGHSREEVQVKMAEIRQKTIASSNCGILISDLFWEWFHSIRHKVKDSTRANYLMKANKHILPIFGGTAVNSLSALDVYIFIDEKLKSGLSNRYISDIIVLMKTIYKYAARTYHVYNPMTEVNMPRRKSAEIQLLDANEQKKLQKFLANNQNHTTLGIAVSLTMGIRIGELCALKWEDIDLEKRILTVRKTIQRISNIDGKTKTKLIITEPKSESSFRNIPIPDSIVPFLKKFESAAENYLISGNSHPIEPRTMQYRFAKILKNANLPSVHFHALRHMFASNCIRLGFDVKSLSEILGHSSVEITLNRYVHSSFEQKKLYMKRVKIAI